MFTMFSVSVWVYSGSLVSSHPKGKLFRLTANNKSCPGFIYINYNLIIGIIIGIIQSSM